MRRILTYLLTFLYVVANEHLMRNPESNRLRWWRNRRLCS